MNDSTSASPASSSASDSDAYNTESARLYFGPVKTPERKFVANNRQLFPPVVPSLLRRSPRLSSPRPQPPPDPVDRECAAEEAEDIDLVAQLVNEVDVDDEDAEMSTSPLGTPPRDEGEFEQDEPLSALADKVLHAIDNPSPPPSPPAALRTNRYPTLNPDGMGDSLDFDVGGLDIMEILAKDVNQTIASTDDDASDNQFFAPGSEIHPDENVGPDLISFDSPRQSVAPKHADASNVLPPQLMSVDDLLSKSPDLEPSSRPPPSMPAFLAGQSVFNGEQSADLMSVEFTRPKTQFLANPLVPEPQERVQRDNLQSRPITNASILPTTPETIITPLRRSLRPRRSILPSPFSQPPTTAMDLSSIAQTSVKKREAFRELEEGVDDSEPERENRQSPSRSVLQSRQRSLEKNLPSFHRELGSLSPASTNVLSKLAFNIPVDSNGTEEYPPRRSSLEPPTFTFSAFMPPAAAAGDVSTPVRADGPQRVSSTPKAEKSPKKFRLQMPVPNDATNTPARRIPIEEAIIQGQLSPEKAAQLGFKATVNPGQSSASVSTPARRILASEKPPPTVAKTSATPKYGSPTKQLGSRRERLVETSHQTISLKGKGKAKAVSPAAQEDTLTTKPGKLPFPIVAATPSTSSSSELHQAVDQNPSTKFPLLPVKPTLKHVTSRIPRINPKPYARNTSDKVSAGTLTLTQDSKPSSRPAENPPAPQKLIRLVEIPKSIVTSPTPLMKATNSTPLLKRKRPVEKHSPIKPRTTFLRQVPSSATRTQTQIQPILTQTWTDQPAYDTIHVSRVCPPSASNPHPPPPESPEPGVSECHEDTIINNPRVSPPPMLMESANPPEPSSIPGPVDPPGSPMKQDIDHLQQLGASQPSKDSLGAPPTPSLAEPVSAGLRRTTRARRAVVQPEAVASRKTTRRKAASQADDVFSGMSMTALKELTMTNTARNQHYLAAKLETEVIRKEGLRPESPAVKVRTIDQRQQEEKDRQRAERAKRRARKSGNDGISASDVEASSDVGYSSPCRNQDEDVDMDMNCDVDGLLNKHRRGAGDDEDYVTPERPARGRGITARLFDDESGDKMEPGHRVKWDRGLYTLVYLDEVKLGSRQTLKENRILKGILAPTAKALRLDTLGNLLHADIPLADLVPENVTVKKFVYDNDVAPAPDPPPPKITRSKSKRK